MFTQKLIHNIFLVASFILAKKETNTFKCLSIDVMINKIQYNDLMENWRAIKRKEVTDTDDP